MEHKVFAIKDQKAHVFMPPWLKGSAGEAERDFRTVVNQKDSIFGQYPKDFDLYQLGTFDDNSGKFKLLDSPLHLISAIELHSSFLNQAIEPALTDFKIPTIGPNRAQKRAQKRKKN